MKPDASSDRAVAAGSGWDSALAWSPDGMKLAFARAAGSKGTDIVVAEVTALGREFRVTDVDGWAVEPKWSPDGQRIAFTYYDQTGDELDINGTRYAFVVGAAGTPVRSGAEICKPHGQSSDTTAGFPLPEWAAPSSGVVRVAVLFVDFPDAQATYSTQQEAERGLPWAEEYLEAMSYGKLDVQYVPHHEWIRAPKSYREYLEENVLGSLDVGGDIYQDAVNSVDDEIDFSQFHSLAVILPSSHFSAGAAPTSSFEVDGALLTRHINNDTPRSETGEMHDWGSTAAHELVHNLGLPDLYPSGNAHDAESLPPARQGRHWSRATFDLMRLGAWFPASEQDSRLILRWSGGGATYARSLGRALEMLAWHRWQLGWLDEEQNRCVREPATTVTLAPVALSGPATVMATVPLGRNEVLVVESRRKVGYDAGQPYASSGQTTTLPVLAEEGVLVYTVDTSLGSRELPIKVAGDSGNGQVDDYPVLSVGESVTVRGYTITLTADEGDTHRVTIVRN